MRVRLRALLVLGIGFLVAGIGLPYVPAFPLWHQRGQQSLAGVATWCRSLQGGLMVAVFQAAARQCARARALAALDGLAFAVGLVLVALAVIAGRRRQRGDAAAS